MHDYRLPVVNDTDAIAPAIMKTVFFGTLTTTRGAAKDAASLNVPRAMAASWGDRKFIFCPEAS